MEHLKDFFDKTKEFFLNKSIGDRLREVLFNKMFVIVDDDEEKCKRIFRSQEDADTWFKARTDKVMTAEIAALEFSGGTIPGTEQYKLTVNVLNPDAAETYGAPVTLRFTFATADTLNANRPTEEPVEIFFTFTNDNGTKQISKIFPYTEGVTEFDITDYIEPDTNEITMLVRGRASGISVTTRATYNAVYLPFSSNFDITANREASDPLSIPYSISGVGQKEVEFMIDSDTIVNETVFEGTASTTYTYRGRLGVGPHTLQMKAYTTIGNKKFESELLYFEFVVNGENLDLTTSMIKAVFPSKTPYFKERNPGLIGEQYVDYTLNWAYFSTSNPNAVVMWKTKLNGVETVVGSREVDEMEGTVGILPDPVKFQPDTVGKYDLYAYVKGAEDVYIGQYTINIVENTAGLREPDGPTLKLNAKGRSNDEPSDTRSDWSSNGYRTIFNNRMTFDGLAGYTGDAVRFDNGATGINTCKPFAVGNNVMTNGGAIVFHFRTFNVEDENVALIKIGSEYAPSTAFLGIYGKKLVFRPSNGESLTYEFAPEEDTHLAIVVHPRTGVTDAQMMFFIFNGIESPGKKYGDTAVFNIGTYSDPSDTNGMIEIGTETGRAAIDIYNIYVYPFMLSMWQGMNLYMINHGGNVAQMMRKNNLFTNNDFNRPILNRLKEQYRVLEVIGDLGKLETSKSKENFFGSVRYTDPINPKFNFERLDGGAYIETAGQSRLEDLMAKSFHLDLNENDTVATYQDGKLTHKNRFVFAEGNVPENGVRIDVAAADSSIARNASHMKMVNRYYPYITVGGEFAEYAGSEYALRTPPQRYALSGQWSQDMANAYDKGKDAKKFPWKHNINFAPDSVPIVVVWHEHEDDPIQVYALACMTEEKKASYANGNHSIYIKAPLSDGTLDPFDRFTGTKGNRGWDNDGVEEVEYVNASDLTNNKTLEGFDDETTRNYSFELCFPKKKDLLDGGTEVWRIFKEEFLKPITDTYGDQGGFNEVIEDIIYMPSFAMYYNKVMDKKMNDSLCRNMHVIRYNMGTTANPKWLWWAKWWDADVSCGLFQDNRMGVDPETDRQTLDENGQYVMAGHDMWLWNALEKNPTFKKWCYELAVASYKAGWDATREKEEQDKITESFSEALYNLDCLIKYLRALRNNNDYTKRMQGSSVPYRHGFIDASYSVREAQDAIGSYASRSVSFRPTGATFPCAVKITSTTKWRFGLGTTSATIVTGLERSPEDGEFSIQMPVGVEISRDFLSVYGADKIRTLDISDFLRYQAAEINLGQLVQVQKLWLGYRTRDELIGNRLNMNSSLSFTGVPNLTRLSEFSITGFNGISVIEGFSKLSHLTKFYAAATSLKNFVPADGAKFDVLELPGTLQTIECRNVALGDITFWDTTTTEESVMVENEDGTSSITKVKVVQEVNQLETAPESLLFIQFIGMGEDPGAHEVVHRWCQMLKNNPHLINTANITYRNIYWENIDPEDLFVLTQIPRGQRNLSGYIKCNTVYTVEERRILIEAFGNDVFTYSAQNTTLVCDGEGDGISISATGPGTTVTEDGVFEVLQGTSAQFQAVGFPIDRTSSQYEWKVDILGTITPGTETFPEIGFGGNNTLHYKTGLLKTTENFYPDTTWTIYCQSTTGINRQEGAATVRIKSRTYPNAVELQYKEASIGYQEDYLEGVLQILDCAQYVFKATHHRLDPETQEDLGYTGTLSDIDGGVWTLKGYDSQLNPLPDNTTGMYASQLILDHLNGKLGFEEFCLLVKSLPVDELNLTLDYTSTWKNGLTLTASPLKIALVSIVYGVLTNNVLSGNLPLFHAVEKAAGVLHERPGTYSSMELKGLRGTLALKGLLKSLPGDLGIKVEDLTTFQNGDYNVLKYLKNVLTLDVTGLTGLVDFDPSPMAWLTGFLAKDLGNTVFLERLGKDLKLGSCQRLMAVDVSGSSLDLSFDGRTLPALSSLKLGSPEYFELPGTPTELEVEEGQKITKIVL